MVRVRSCTTTADASATTALAANEERTAWRLQNVGTNPLFYKKGLSCSTSDYTGILAAETSSKEGEGGVASQEGESVYLGVITVAGTTPAYTVSEDIRAN